MQFTVKRKDFNFLHFNKKLNSKSVTLNWQIKLVNLLRIQKRNITTTYSFSRDTLAPLKHLALTYKKFKSVF
jgi:hypothetical protein